MRITRFWGSPSFLLAIQVLLFSLLLEECCSFCPSLAASSSLSTSRLNSAATTCRRGAVQQERICIGDVALKRRAGRAVAARQREILRCSADTTTDFPPIPGKKRENFPFVLRRGKPHELDLLAILSTEAFTPQGEWYNVVQRLKHTLTVWDLQAQFYQRYYQWPQIVREFDPPMDEARYALLVAAKPTGVAVGMTELCVCPSPVPADVKNALEIKDTALYVSNLAVAAEHRRKGVGEALVGWCETLGQEWGQSHVFLHVERDNQAAIAFYKALGFTKVTRDIEWYGRIRRADLASQNTIVLFKELEGGGEGRAHAGGEEERVRVDVEQEEKA